MAQGSLVDHPVQVFGLSIGGQAEEPQCGWCLGWDSDAERYSVRLFNRDVVLAPEANISLLPCDGSLEATFDELKEDQVFNAIRAETETAYLGGENTTTCFELPEHLADEAPEKALDVFERDLEILFSLLSLVPETVGATEKLSRTPSLLRLSSEKMTAASAFDDKDLENGEVERFLTWSMRRKLCMLYCIHGGGSIELCPQDKNGHCQQDGIEVPLRHGRLLLFRHDQMSYTYRPDGESLVVQAWLLDATPSLEFRELPQPPGIYGLDRIHVVSATERFPANCDGCDMTFAMFCAGTDALADPPMSRFDKELYWADDANAPLYGRAYIIHGSFCSDEALIGFDPDFFGLDVDEAEAMAPPQRWVLEVSYEVLFNGGWTKDTLLGKRIGTFIGDSGSEWNQMYWKQDRFVSTCNSGSVTCSRTAHLLGLTGPNICVDTACSSSLVATNVASHMMRHSVPHGSAADSRAVSAEGNRAALESAICMGILVLMHPAGWIGECAATMLSYRGRCFTFDSSADGFIRGEGCCAVHLQSMADENRSASDRSLAVLMGSCSNQDGRSASLTAPHGPSQQECMRGSLREARLQPAEICLSECHGTGTALGDPIEIGAVRSVMLGKRETPILHCSAKAHVGHEEANAGVCGLIKVVLMLNGAVSLPNPHLRILNPHLDINGYPVVFTNELTSTSYHDQCMGVSSFGFGGSNARADLWSDVDKGHLKDGQRIHLSKEEAVTWMDRIVNNGGPSAEKSIDFLKPKKGH
eukprot:TRINITY_DN4510_c0_g1_i11.p1 TRINITY_DN4510_c0_g1~~TRINITY_DN4510_c0_g1_i11.p1  ORF type:complete len:757 (-),score=116.87 TRINITY_DN4510_c0_g1_i11:1560-3830(-)